MDRVVDAMWRLVGFLVGAGFIGAITHVNVMGSGGYESANAPIIIGMAAVLVLGGGFGAYAWRKGHWIGALLLWFCLLGGEGFWLVTNVEREYAAAQATEAPAKLAAQKRKAAEERVRKAEVDRTKAYDTAALNREKPGCRDGCIKDAASDKAKADEELRLAREDLALLPPVPSATRIEEALGIETWKWDLGKAMMKALATLAGAIMCSLALHSGKKAARVEPKSAQTRGREISVEPVAACSEPKRPAVERLTLSAPDTGRRHVSAFLAEHLRPDPDGAISLRDLRQLYALWCERMHAAPLPDSELAQHMRELFTAAQLALEPRPATRDVIVRGAALAA